jgi:Hemerythrin HHE cation binding domain
MDAFELLKADHKTVSGLFDELEAATGKAKLSVFAQIKTELELHTHIEETIFYPALEKLEETHDLILEAYEEHKMVKTLLAKLSRARTANDEWQAQAKVLRENVEHHVNEEENELFDKADDALSDEEIEALGQRMEAEKARKQGRPAQRSTTKKKGIVSRIAEFVGLGSSSSSKKSGPAKKGAAKKESARKATTKNSGTKKRASKKAASSTKRASKSAASKRSSRSKKSATKKRRR